MQFGNVVGVEKPISRLVLGIVRFGEDAKDKAFEVLDAYFEAGGNCVDSSHSYRAGGTSRILGEWIESRGVREKIVIHEKCCHPNRSGKNFSAEAMTSNLHDSLGWWRTDFLDILTFHRDDPEYPVEPLVRALNEHKAAGKVGAWGGSNWEIARIEEFNACAAELGLQGMSLNNPNLSLADCKKPMWDGCITSSLADIAWHESTQFPLFSWSAAAAGYFAGVDRQDVLDSYDTPISQARRARALEMAEKKGEAVNTIAMAYVLNQAFPTFALIGPANPDELKLYLRALEVPLTREEVLWLRDG